MSSGSLTCKSAIDHDVRNPVAAKTIGAMKAASHLACSV